MLDILKENDKIDSVWCTLRQFLEIGVPAFHDSRLIAGELGFAPHGVLIAEYFTAGMVTRQVFMLNFTSWGSIMPTPLANGLF